MNYYKMPWAGRLPNVGICYLPILKAISSRPAGQLVVTTEVSLTYQITIFPWCLPFVFMPTLCLNFIVVFAVVVFN